MRSRGSSRRPWSWQKPAQNNAASILKDVIARSVVLGCVSAVLLSACQIDLVLDVVIRDDGSGTVDFTIAADDEVMSYLDASDVDLSGLATGGWTLRGPLSGPDSTSVQLSKEVPSAEQFDDVIAQLDDGRLVTDVEVDIEVGIGTTDYEATLVVAPTMTARDFSDRELTALLDGEPFGEQLDVLEQRAGRPLDEAVVFVASLTMPDGSTSEVSTTLADGVAKTVSGTTSYLDDTVDDRRAAAQTARDAFDDSIRTVAVFWGIAALVVVVLLSIGWRRRHRMLRGDPTAVG